MVKITDFCENRNIWDNVSVQLNNTMTCTVWTNRGGVLADVTQQYHKEVTLHQEWVVRSNSSNIKLSLHLLLVFNTLKNALLKTLYAVLRTVNLRINSETTFRQTLTLLAKPSKPNKTVLSELKIKLCYIADSNKNVYSQEPNWPATTAN